MNEPATRDRSADDQAGQIYEAYDRLSEAVSPPENSSALIAHRIRARRVRRLAVVAIGGLLAAAALAFIILDLVWARSRN